MSKGTLFFFYFENLLNSNKPQDKRFRDTRFFGGHIDRVLQGLTVPTLNAL